MESVKDVFARYRDTLSELYDANETGSLTLLAISEITALSRAMIKAFPEQLLSETQSARLNNILDQLKTGKPIQYILGETEFYGLPFKVNPSVLIPRPETEELVQWIIETVGGLQFAVGSGQLAGSIVDIGTGSGCIAISLKKNLPQFSVSAIDISEEALKTAIENADLNEVKVDFARIDILNPDKTSSHISRLTFHISVIVSNPPYVTQRDKTQMHANVTDFEPHSALFVPEDDPLIFYKAIADFAIKNLIPGGLLFFEINEAYGGQIIEMLTSKSFKNIELKKDMRGRDRMVKAMREGSSGRF